MLINKFLRRLPSFIVPRCAFSLVYVLESAVVGICRSYFIQFRNVTSYEIVCSPGFLSPIGCLENLVVSFPVYLYSHTSCFLPGYVHNQH